MVTTFADLYRLKTDEIATLQSEYEAPSPRELLGEARDLLARLA